MYALGITELGGPEVIRRVAAPSLTPRAGAVVLRVLATSYNNIDALLRREDFGLGFPIVPGSDAVGEVIQGDLPAGTKVMVNPGIPCGDCPECRAGLQCQTVQILGVHVPGGYGSELLVDVKQAVTLPSDSPAVETLAACPLTFLTAWRMLTTRAQVGEGEEVMIWGANGGLGSAAVAICRFLGAKTTAVVRKSAYEQPLLDYGADSVFTIEEPADVLSHIRTRRAGAFDVVFEGPGAATWGTSMQAVRVGGRIVTAGVTSGAIADLDIEQLYYRQITVLGSRMGYADEFNEVTKLLLAGKLHPLIADVASINDASDVHRRAEDHQDVCGKIVMLHEQH